MKPTALAGLVSATLLVSGTALACDDMKMSGDDSQASRAPDAQVAAAEKASDKTSTPATVKQKVPVKQKTAGKAPQGSPATARTSG